MKSDVVIDMFDRVRIRRTDLTEKENLADLIGVVYGITTPSVMLGPEESPVKEIIGELKEDLAYNVNIEEIDLNIWLASDLVEFVDHNPGCEMRLGNMWMVRLESGEWVEKKPKATGLWNKIRKLFSSQ